MPSLPLFLSPFLSLDIKRRHPARELRDIYRDHLSRFNRPLRPASDGVLRKNLGGDPRYRPSIGLELGWQGGINYTLRINHRLLRIWGWRMRGTIIRRSPED